jgi:superoxide dismutase, Cu-Zn family
MRPRVGFLGRRVAVVAIIALAATVPASTGAVRADQDGARVLLRNAGGQPVGTVRLDQEDGAVLVRAGVHDLTPGFHGFHVHAVGQCVPPFTSAGGHHNPGGSGHGAHAGDMPSLLVGADGTGELRFKTDRFTVAELLDADGSAIIVHASPDNFAHIPPRYYSTTEATYGPDSVTLATGDAGSRVACGVVR